MRTLKTCAGLTAEMSRKKGGNCNAKNCYFREIFRCEKKISASKHFHKQKKNFFFFFKNKILWISGRITEVLLYEVVSEGFSEHHIILAQQKTPHCRGICLNGTRQILPHPMWEQKNNMCTFVRMVHNSFLMMLVCVYKTTVISKNNQSFLPLSQL